ncbi:MAG TPA: Gfo/Idh/MocA family oxidoreductase [Sedimentisphaerales bacterium]|nr:Gfo/Idh/MocA family oxidoreductase [Sedimentisphaerales bacterium]
MSKLTRRQFIKRTTAIGAACTIGFPRFLRGRGLNEKLQVGFVATEGRARAHTKASHEAGLRCMAFAEVDRTRWDGVLKKEGWSEAKGYTDWRKVFENHAKELDVVFVATPDHNHFAPSMTAVSMGIHCYTEKPLSWSVREALLLQKAYEKNKNVVTQMGNQGHAGMGWRMAYEYIKAGALGDIKAFHSWTNRPGWPQGGDRPDWTDPVPETLDWDAWIGSAPMRPFAGPRQGSRRGRGPYHPFNWRGVVDFGCGALGDMACHITDGVYAIMEPSYAATAEPVVMTGPVQDQWPGGMVVKCTYRAQGSWPAFTTYWYEGKDKDGKPFMPEIPEELKAEGRKLPTNGNIVIGTKGKMMSSGAYWDAPILMPLSRHREFGRPKQLIERSPGHHQEFFMSCRGEKPREFSRSNFSYSGPMTANIQLINLCARADKKIELNEAGKITSDPVLNELVWREPRSGWGPLEMNV